MPKILIADKMSPRAEEIFKQRGLEVDVTPGLDREGLIDIIGQYDGLAVRSATKVTPPVLAAADKLKVIGRAGIGVDNIDLPAATMHGVVVMNTPFGNSITTAEHAIAMIFSLAREIPIANTSTHAGKWEKSRFMGVELSGKVLGIIGCGNIGSIVASRALGLNMKVMAYDPFLLAERAVEIGVEKTELDDLLARADVISLHTPLTDSTRHIIDADALAKTKPGVYIVNCARGGLIAEKDLLAALEAGHVAGAALDVFEEEPAHESIFFGMENVICTPHLGAATKEAQVNVAIQIAEQISDYLLDGAVTNAINMPAIPAEDAPRLKPFVILAEQLGLLAGQLMADSPFSIHIEYAGDVGELNYTPLTAAAVAAVLRPLMSEVNMVNAPALAKERGVAVSETTCQSMGAYDTYIRLTVKTDEGDYSTAGTVFSDGRPRIIQLKGINMEAGLTPHMLYVNNNDQPGFIGALGTLLGRHDINIASFSLGREQAGGEAISLIATDSKISQDVLDAVQALKQVIRTKALNFQIL